MKLASALLFLLLVGCAGTPIDHKLSPEIVGQMNEVYNPVVEKGFCVSDRVYNVFESYIPFVCPVPLCEPGSIVFHTHPCTEPVCANIIDITVWKEYYERYGNTLFGVMCGKGKYKIYDIKTMR